VVPHCNTLPNYYDVVVSSEVIEHVLKDMQLTMLDSIHNSISPGGSLILTTPVGDVADIWFSLHGQQPLEEWLTESACGEILKAAGFRIVDHHLMYSYTHDGSDVGQPEDNELNLYHVIPLYQVWHSVKELA
jgi:2-polyprenyl-3-methyl-5-hydroxy-6-metoxy-1,4-benzoquinol methylase